MMLTDIHGVIAGPGAAPTRQSGAVADLVKDIHNAIAELAGVTRYPDLTAAIDQLAALSQSAAKPSSGIPLEAGIAWQAGAFDTERKAVTVEGHAWYRHDHPKVSQSAAGQSARDASSIFDPKQKTPYEMGFSDGYAKAQKIAGQSVGEAMWLCRNRMPDGTWQAWTEVRDAQTVEGFKRFAQEHPDRHEIRQFYATPQPQSQSAAVGEAVTAGVLPLPEPAAHRYWSKGNSSRWQLAGKAVPPDAEPLYSADQMHAYAARCMLHALAAPARPDKTVKNYR
jgi:hypothetical protein